MRSVAEPAWNGTTMRTGWVGQSRVACAMAAVEDMADTASAASTEAVMSARKFVDLLKRMVGLSWILRRFALALIRNMRATPNGHVSGRC
ncbi:hypothetical protein D3C87_1469920 [compost metagenome]